ncbi:hypothetical protein Emed_004325 [Eimeria media]
MRDRFNELRSLAMQLHPAAASQMHQGEGPPCPSSPRGALAGAHDLEAPLAGGPLGASSQGPPEGAFLAAYFQKVDVLKAALAEIGEKVNHLQALKTRVVEATNPDEEKDLSHELHKVLDSATLLTQKCKRALDVLKAENKAFAEAESGSLSKVSELQIRTNLHQTLAAQLQQQIQLLQVRQADYRLQVKKKVLRQIKIGLSVRVVIGRTQHSGFYPEAVDAEIEGMVDSGELTATTAIKMRVTGSHQTLRNATADIQDKYRDIRRLEQSVAELHQMFVELSFLVEAQGEMVEHIQYSVSQAKEYTGFAAKAEKELLQARRNQKSAKARMFWITVILIVLATLVLVPVFVTLLK